MSKSKLNITLVLVLSSLVGCVATEEVVTIYTDINPTAKDPIDVRVVYRGKQIKEED